MHHALLFRQLTDDLVYFTRGTELDEDTRARFAARAIALFVYVLARGPRTPAAAAATVDESEAAAGVVSA